MGFRKITRKAAQNFPIGFVDKIDEMVVTLGETFFEMKILKF